MSRRVITVAFALLAACGPTPGGGSGGGGNPPFVLQSIFVGSCVAHPNAADETCTAERINSSAGADVRATFEGGCVASGGVYSVGQCNAGAPYGCCKVVMPADTQATVTAAYSCYIGDAYKPTTTFNVEEACTLSGGTYSPGPPPL